MQRAVLSIALLSACGRVAFDLQGDAATVSDGRASDGFATGPFGAPTPVTFVTAIEEDDAALGPGLLELVFDTVGPGGESLFVVTRSSTSSPWSAPTAIAEVYAAGADDDGPFITYDGLTLYFSSTRSGGPGIDDLWMTTRATTQSPWTTPTLIPNLSSAGIDLAPAVTGDELYGLFSSNRGGNRDIYVVTRATRADTWSTPVKEANLSSGALDDEPMLLPDGLTVVMQSERDGNGDLYIATRLSRTAPWGTPAPIAELNTADDENDPWLSADGSQIWFTRGTGVARDIYTATR